MTHKLVPAHPPSKVDPAAAILGIVVAIVGGFGVTLTDYMTADELAIVIGSLMAVAATTRAVWQRVAARRHGIPDSPLSSLPPSESTTVDDGA